MIFHENRLLADDSREISYLIYFKLGKMSQNVLSAAVMIGALRVKFHLNLEILIRDPFMCTMSHPSKWKNSLVYKGLTTEHFETKMSYSDSL